MKRWFGWSLLLCAALLSLLCAPALAEGSVVPDDGQYTCWVRSDSDMFRVTKCVLDVRAGEITATLTLSGQGYGYLYVGTGEQADAAPKESWVPFVLDEDGKKTFEIQIPALDMDLDVAAYSIKYSKWYDRVLNFEAVSLKPYAAPAPEPEKAAVVQPDGTYSVNVTTDSALLTVTDCTIEVSGGKIEALLTVKGESYDQLYSGLAKDARTDKAGWVSSNPNGGGNGSFRLDVAGLNIDIPVATHSAKKDLWYDRTIRLDSGAMTAIP